MLWRSEGLVEKSMLLRHASAEIEGFNHKDDHEKPLIEKGIIDCKNLSEWLKKLFRF